MACNAMDLWSFSELVGAFLDLSIAYFLLCASSFVFLASRFVGLFGLSLPCPCDGLFVNPNSKNYCLHRLLVDFPVENVSSVQMSVRGKPPFDSLFVEDRNLDLSRKFVGNGDCCGTGFDGLESEASCSSMSDGRRSNIVVSRELNAGNKNGVDVKGKGIMIQRRRSGIRRRSKGVSSNDLQGVPQSLPCVNKNKNERTDVGVEEHCFLDDREADTVTCMRKTELHDINYNQPIDENSVKEKNMVFDVDPKGDSQSGLDGSINTVRVLKQALEEEHNACASLYLELEKERNSAATAADEAMAMILRLQEEKASIELLARQFQRMIEENSAYDAEEMSILKEILLRREREINFLEKEVEAYKQILNSGYEQLGDYVQDIDDNHRREHVSIDLTDYSDQILTELSETIEKKDLGKTREVTFIDMQKSSVQLGIQERKKDVGFNQKRYPGEQFSSSIDDVNQELLDKEMSSVDNIEHAPPKEGQKLETHQVSYKSSNSQGQGLQEKTIPIIRGEQEENGSENLERSDKDVGSEVPGKIMFDQELHVHNVHVIGYSSKDSYDKKKNESETGLTKINNCDRPNEASIIQKINAKRDSSSASKLDTLTNRRSLDLATRPPLSGSWGKFSLPNMRRSSMSAIDTERLKLDIEVEWLQEKLKAVQEGREKLSLSVEPKEKDMLQLQLLEDIVRQLQEIRQLREPRKTIRQVSLLEMVNENCHQKIGKNVVIPH